MKSKWINWAVAAVFVFGFGVPLNSMATGGCSACYSKCKTIYNQCLASGQPASTCLSQYVACRADCPC